MFASNLLFWLDMSFWKKFALITVVSVVLSGIFFALTTWIPEFSEVFFSLFGLAGCGFVFLQKENVSYKYLAGLVIGSIIVGFLTMTFLYLKLLLGPGSFLGPSPDIAFIIQSLQIAAVLSVLSFFGGLVGIVLKGVYSLYGNKLDHVIVAIGPFIALIASLTVYRVKIGGTIASSYYGWPYPFVTHQIKDVIDRQFIDKWMFSPGSLFHYVIFDYALYLGAFLLMYCFVDIFNKNFKKFKINRTIVLFGVLVLMIGSMLAYAPVRRMDAVRQISEAKSCTQDPDCTIVNHVSSLYCSASVNKINEKRISTLLSSFPEDPKVSCSTHMRAVCFEGTCGLTDQPVSDPDSWELLKFRIKNCQVRSVMRTHSSAVMAVLKNGIVMNTKEPDSENLFEIVAWAKDRCGEVQMATE